MFHLVEEQMQIRYFQSCGSIIDIYIYIYMCVCVCVCVFDVATP